MSQVTTQATQVNEEGGDDEGGLPGSIQQRQRDEKTPRAAQSLTSSAEPAMNAVSKGQDLEQQNEKEVDSGKQEQKTMRKERRREDAPVALQRFQEKVQRWSESVEAWSVRQREKSERRRQGVRDAETEVDPATGQVKEPKGDNIIQRKAIIVVVCVVLCWVYFVYTWRVCTVNIRQEPFRTTASRATGIGLLVAFNILWLMTIWTYVKVVLTGPGLVRDHVDISDPPPAREGGDGAAYPAFEGPAQPDAQGGHPSHGSAPPLAPLAQSAVDDRSSLPATSTVAGADLAKNSTEGAEDPRSEDTETTGAAIAGPLAAGLSASKDESEKVHQEEAIGEKHGQARELAEDKRSTNAMREDLGQDHEHEKEAILKGVQGHDTIYSGKGTSEETRTVHPPTPPPPPMQYGAPAPIPPGPLPEPVRMVSQTAPLDPVNRYCYRCKRVKPPRAHHCRHCATCVLKMDHHCPWVGGCVGARNHKFFYNFLTWVTILEIYTMISTAVLFSRGIHIGPEGWNLDGYMISLFPITALFTMFTSLLLGTHTYLFLLNLTTIEHMAYDRTKAREDILLSRYVDSLPGNGAKGKLGFASQVREKRRIKAKWAKEWGSLKTEGNLWWLDGLHNNAKAISSDEREAALFASEKSEEVVGAARRRLSSSTYARVVPWYSAVGSNWREVMGHRPYEWFLPIGKSAADGLSYATNWRFGPGGIQRRRSEW